MGCTTRSAVRKSKKMPSYFRYKQQVSLLSHGCQDHQGLTQAWFRRRIFVASNAIQTIDNEVSHLIIYCLNCIRCDGNSTSKTGLKLGLAPIKGPCHFSIQKGPESCSLNVLGEDLWYSE